jgi:hypothetical protein
MSCSINHTCAETSISNESIFLFRVSLFCEHDIYVSDGSPPQSFLWNPLSLFYSLLSSFLLLPCRRVLFPKQSPIAGKVYSCVPSNMVWWLHEYRIRKAMYIYRIRVWIAFSKYFFTHSFSLM